MWPPLALVVAATVAWELIVEFFDVSSFVIAKPSDIAAELVNESAMLADATWITTQEVLWGFSSASSSASRSPCSSSDSNGPSARSTR